MKKGYFHIADMDSVQAALATLEGFRNIKQE